MGRTFTLVTIAAALAGCSHKKSEGLPPAQDWSADRADVVPPGVGPAASPHEPHVAVGGGDPSDPHAGVDMGGGAMGGGDMGGGGEDNPHAGVDMTNPHAGVDMTNPHAAGVAANPNRPADPTHHIRGVIKVGPKAKDQVKPGTTVFVYAEMADATGKPVSPPLAVLKLTWQKDELPFELSEANAMVPGTPLTGEVIVLAHYDQDGDAKSKEPGDLLGELKVKVPAEAVTVMLDPI